jgi:hypothetical protein
MSLLTSVNVGSPDQAYFIENIGGTGAAGAVAPCIKGTGIGAVRVGDPTVGIVVRGDASGAGYIRGGAATSVAGSFLTLGASLAQPAQIVMSDANVSIAAPLLLTGAGNDLTVADDINVGGNVVLTNGSTGKSITGFYSVTTAVAGAGAQANPAGITAGTYLVAYVPASGNQGQQPSGVFYWSGTAWVGNAVGANSTDIDILPTVGNATLTIGGGAPSVPGTLYWRKLLG